MLPHWQDSVREPDLAITTPGPQKIEPQDGPYLFLQLFSPSISPRGPQEHLPFWFIELKEEIRDGAQPRERVYG